MGFAPGIVCKNQFQALALIGSSETRGKDSEWIFDCGVTDTMSFDISDFTNVFTPQKKFVQTANGHLIPVEGAGTIKISPSMKISNCLYVPPMANKLLSVSHVTKELQCSLLMQPNFCVLQDLKTSSTVGRGTEQEGLYYVDKVAQPGIAMLTHGSNESQGWLWASPVRTPFIGYLFLLFPSFSNTQFSFHRDTCFLAKSHRHSFKLNNSCVNTSFSPDTL